jgi:hypothetical protein
MLENHIIFDQQLLEAETQLCPSLLLSTKAVIKKVLLIISNP